MDYITLSELLKRNSLSLAPCQDSGASQQNTIVSKHFTRPQFDSSSFTSASCHSAIASLGEWSNKRHRASEETDPTKTSRSELQAFEKNDDACKRSVVKGRLFPQKFSSQLQDFEKDADACQTSVEKGTPVSQRSRLESEKNDDACKKVAGKCSPSLQTLISEAQASEKSDESCRANLGKFLHTLRSESEVSEKKYEACERSSVRNDQPFNFENEVYKLNLGKDRLSSQNARSEMQDFDENEKTCKRKFAKDRSLMQKRGIESQKDLVQSSERLIFVRGRIHLWNGSSHENACALKFDCLAFVDGTATVCCILSYFDPRLLGLLVDLVSWNFIPVKGRGACLEIHELQVVEECSIVSPYLSPTSANTRNKMIETPPFKQKPKARLATAGLVYYMSSLFTLPCRDSRACNLQHSMQSSESNVVKQSIRCEGKHNSSSAQTMVGFLIGIIKCVHSPTCISVAENCEAAGVNASTSGDAIAYIFFSGSVCAWRPIVSTALGKCIKITGLRNKIFYVGPERRQYQVLAATRTSIVSISLPPDTIGGKNDLYNINVNKVSVAELDGKIGKETQSMIPATLFGKGNRHFASYFGVVTDVYMHGGLLELDDRVFLLLTHQPLTQVHGLRVGAQVIARHFHVLKVKSTWDKVLLLGACFVSHVTVIGFSPLRTQYVVRPSSRSCLSFYIESLPFLWAFWSLHLIASFRQKFHGICSNKDILGSSKTEGFLQRYISYFVRDTAAKKRDVFKENFSHDKYCNLGEPFYGTLLQVPPIAHFQKQVCSLLEDPMSLLWQERCNTCKDNLIFSRTSSGNQISYSGANQSASSIFRQIVSSQELGVMLLGFLQFSLASAKLQLVDASGALDVVIPDLQYGHLIHQIFQIMSFNLVIEALDESLIKQVKCNNSITSWSKIFKGMEAASEQGSPFYFYIVFYMKEAYSVQLPLQTIPDFNMAAQKTCKEIILCDDKDNPYRARFQIIVVTYKYPLRLKRFAEEIDTCRGSFAVEALLLPYDILVPSHDDVSATNIQTSQELCAGSIPFACMLRGYEKVEQIRDKALIPVTGEENSLCCYPVFVSQCESSGSAAEPEMRKIIIQFFDQSLCFHQVVKLGHCYLINSLQDHSLSVTIDAKNPVWSLDVVSSSEEVASEWTGGGMQVADAILKVSKAFLCVHNDFLQKARVHVKPVLNVQKVIDEATTSRRSKSNNRTSLLDGSLVSFSGSIEHMQVLKSRKLTKESFFCKGFSQNCVILHVKDLKKSLMVQVTCNFDGYAWPIGLGPGATVSFLRLLLERNCHGDLSFQTISSTMIIVHSVNEMGSFATHKNLSFSGAEYWFENEKEEESDCRDNILDISRHHLISNTMRLFCKVVAVYKLVLQRHNAEVSQSSHSSRSKVHSCLNYKISFASVLVDDGSGLAECWATDDRAAYLLNLHYPTNPVHAASLKKPISASLNQQLASLMTKYQKVKVKNNSYMLENARTLYSIIGDTDQTLNNNEEKLIHQIVQRALHAGPLLITARPLGMKNRLEVADCRDCEDFDTTVLLHDEHEIYTIGCIIPRLFAEKAEQVNYVHYLNKLTEELSVIL